jgi:hypothetical protein
MRNRIGIPPIEREIDAGAGTPLSPGVNAQKVSHHPSHVGMNPEVEEAARHDDLPYVGGFDKPVTERDTNAGLYVGLLVGVLAILIAVLVISALF